MQILIQNGIEHGTKVVFLRGEWDSTQDIEEFKRLKDTLVSSNQTLHKVTIDLSAASHIPRYCIEHLVSVLGVANHYDITLELFYTQPLSYIRQIMLPFPELLRLITTFEDVA